MGRIDKNFAMLLAVLFLMPLVTIQHPTLKAQSAINSAPALQWQKEFGNSNSEFVSNLIQTSDGGYAFLDLGSSHGVWAMVPSTFYKIDSSGIIQWTKTIDWFTAINLTQTSDKGYEISGLWNTYGTTYETTSTLIKTDANGNIQWYENSSSSESPVYPLINPSPKIQTTDGGVASDESGSIIKTDSNGNVQWVKNLTFSYLTDYKFPLHLSYLIETSDGALAGIGIGVTNTEHGSGYIYLVKTEAFLPLPSPTQLPTPIATPIVIFGKTVSTALIIAIALIVALIAVISAIFLFYKRHRKTAKISDGESTSA